MLVMDVMVVVVVVVVGLDLYVIIVVVVSVRMVRTNVTVMMISNVATVVTAGEPSDYGVILLDRNAIRLRQWAATTS